MASLRKRGNKFVVTYVDHNKSTKSKQAWKSFATEAEASLFKAQIELEQARHGSVAGVVLNATGITVRQLLHEFVEIYGSSKWVMSTYSSNKSLIENYINPQIGDVDLALITNKFVDKLYRDLQKVRYIPTAQKTKNVGKTLSVSMIYSIHKIMRCAFNQAVRWDYIQVNPFDKALLPDYHPDEKKFWSVSEVEQALSACDDSRLLIAIHLAFACSMRAGEITGLQWANLHLSEETIEQDDSFVYIDRELTRVDAKAAKALGEKDIIFKFPKILPGKRSDLVLKAPKTRSSIRRVYIPRTCAELLLAHKKQQQEHIRLLKEEWDEDYLDYDLVLTERSGRPWQNYLKHFTRLIERCGLPKVDFHSLRHSSTNYKLILSGGDIKAVQGDNGHAEAQMVVKQYSHIQDEHRKVMAIRFEQDFFGSDGTKRKTEPPKTLRNSVLTEQSAAGSGTTQAAAVSDDENETLLLLMKEMMGQNPQFAQQLRAVLTGVETT